MKLTTESEVKPENGSGVGSLLEILVRLDGKKLIKLEFSPVAEGIDSLRPELEASIAIGVLQDLDHDLRKRGGSLDEVVLEFSGSLHSEYQRVFDLYAKLAGRPKITVSTSLTSKLSLKKGGRVVVGGAGKDTVKAIRIVNTCAPLAGAPILYFGRGADDGWYEELELVKHLAAHYQLELHHLQMSRYQYSGTGVLRFTSRANWRELFLICFARSLGEEIITGINVDSLALIEPPYDHDRHLTTFFGQLRPVLGILGKVLDAPIRDLPGEFVVYAATRNDPLWSQTASCLSHRDCTETDPCNKCRGFQIYEKILAGEELTEDQIRFIHSERYIGDSALRILYPLTDQPVPSLL